MGPTLSQCATILIVKEWLLHIKPTMSPLCSFESTLKMYNLTTECIYIHKNIVTMQINCCHDLAKYLENIHHGYKITF